MQSRVVGQMESWRGLGRRVGREALGWLAAVRKSVTSPGGMAADGNGHDRANGVGGAGIVHADVGSGAGMTDAAAAAGGAVRTCASGAVRPGDGTQTRDDRAAGDQNGTAEQDRIALGTGVQEQIDCGAGVREQNHLNALGQARVGTPEHAQVTMPERRVSVPVQGRVPGWLQTGAAWSWRLLILAAAIYLVTRVLGILYVVVVPCIAALLLTALLQPLTDRLCRAGLPRLAATWATLLIAAAVLGGLVTLVAT